MVVALYVFQLLVQLVVALFQDVNHFQIEVVHILKIILKFGHQFHVEDVFHQ